MPNCAVFMEVLCLNGKSVSVEPSEGLQEAKIQVAKLLGTLPDAVSISCGGQILSELESFSEAEFDAPLFAIVDQERLEVAKHLTKIQEELVDFQKQCVQRQEIRENYEEKKRELHMDWCGDVFTVENRLKEGNLTPREEADLVSRLGRLDRLEVMRFCNSRRQDNLLRKYGRLCDRIDWTKERLFFALKEQKSDRLSELMDEFEIKTDVPSYESLQDLLWWEPEDGFQEERKKWRHLFKTADSLQEPLEHLCPRLLRREIWSKSKRSWKFDPNETPQGRSLRKGARPKARSRQVIRKEGRNQLQEYSFD